MYVNTGRSKVYVYKSVDQIYMSFPQIHYHPVINEDDRKGVKAKERDK